MRVEIHKYGEIEVAEDLILHFPEGLHGFPELKRGCLVLYSRTPGLRWLQSVDDPSLAFLTIEPHFIFPDYEAELPDSDSLALGLTEADQAAILTLVTISEDGSAITTNLLAPIVINIRTRCARQVILETDGYLTRHAISSHIMGEIHAGADAQNR